MVTILVGPTRHQFLAHKSIICKEQYFKAAFTGQFKEAHTKTLKLFEEDPANFDNLLRWIYSRVDFNLHNLVSNSEEEVANWPAHFRSLVELHVLSDKLNIKDLPDLIIDYLSVRRSSVVGKRKRGTVLVPANEDITFVYHNTVPNSKLRRSLASMVANNIVNNELDAAYYEASFEAKPRFAADLVMAVKKASKAGVGRPRVGNVK
jgi:BTB/POZ domain